MQDQRHIGFRGDFLKRLRSNYRGLRRSGMTRAQALRAAWGWAQIEG